MSGDNGSFTARKRIIMLIAAAILLIAGVFVLYKNLIGENSTDEVRLSDHVSDAAMPEIMASRTFDDVFYDIDQSDPLRYLIEPDHFSATVTVIDAYNTFSSVTYSVVRFDGKFRIENSSSLVIYDGEKLYKKTPTYTIVEERDDYDLFEELGVPDLSGIREQLKENSSAQVDYDGTSFTATFFDKNGRTTKSCVISAENGIIISETLLYNGNIRREISIENVKILTDTDVTPDMFTLPE